ncbi:MAG: DUF2169 domain-containing protein [Pseudomonadota bacterium]|nr:DUF2169 domain-containing protein [Pseudomonadota bacterium]
MELLNATPMQAGYTMGMQPDGRELLVVAVKGTFTLPAQGEEARLADGQIPLVMADTFTGEPGFSAPVHEADYPPHKRRCDVLLIGSAYAPGGRPATRVEVGIGIGTIDKTFAVIGDRRWEAGALAIGPGRPEAFTVMPITYDRAFGGIDDCHPDPARLRAFMANPVGKGYHGHLKPAWVDGTPLPNSEEPGRAVTMPDGAYRPMSFGPVGRNWEPRYRLAGTYDQHWLDHVFPFLPADFDAGYYQAAPADQQMDYPQGGEEVRLTQLTAEGHTLFRLPGMAVPVAFFLKKGGRQEQRARIDTLVLEPDAGRFTMTWRAALPLKRNMFEVAQVLVGTLSRGWWRARDLGKTYYPSLAALSRANREEAGE